MIYITCIYDDMGRKVGEVSKCDHSPILRWWEVVIGVSIGLITASLIFV